MEWCCGGSVERASHPNLSTVSTVVNNLGEFFTRDVNTNSKRVLYFARMHIMLACGLHTGRRYKAIGDYSYTVHVEHIDIHDQDGSLVAVV